MVRFLVFAVGYAPVVSGYSLLVFSEYQLLFSLRFMSHPPVGESSFGDQDGMGIAAGIASSDQTSYCSRGIMSLTSL